MSGAITGTTLAIMGGIDAAGALGGAAISSSAAGNAASEQSNAANHAADLQYQASQNALDFQKQQYNQSQSNIQPWIQSGQQGLSNLDYLLGIGSPTQGSQPGSAPSPIMNGAGTNMNNGAPSLNGMPALSNRPSPMATPSGGAASPINSINGNAGAGLTPNGIQPGGGAANSVNAFNPTSGAVAGPAGSFNPGGSSITPRGGPVMPANSLAGASAPIASNGASPAAGASASGGANPALGGFGSLMQGYGKQFTAPTAAEAMQSPGTQEQLALGTQALQQSAAARGNLLTGGTGQALEQYGQQLGATGYQNAYNNSYNTFADNYNQYQQQQANEYNRLAALSGIGQTSAQQLGSLGQGASNNVTSNLLGTASAMGQDYQNAGAANASGIVGSANAFSGALGSTGSSLQNLLLLSQLQGGGAANYGGAAQTGELG